MKDSEFKCGYVAIVGRPNVGKSTLLNRIIGQKISITTSKPQTTRHRILGIKNTDQSQVIYVDTPGIQSHAANAMNRFMYRAASSSLSEVDVVLMVVEALNWQDEDNYLLSKFQSVDVPVLLAVNKLDKVKNKSSLLPQLELVSKKFAFSEIVPVSAVSGEGLDALEMVIDNYLPASRPYFPIDQVTDRSERFLAAELVREKLMRTLGDELPYSLTVEIEKFTEQENLKRINAIIWVSRPGHKGIVIGKQGQQLKQVGEQARKDMEVMFDCKVYLELWVKVKQGWADDERALRSLGYGDPGE